MIHGPSLIRVRRLIPGGLLLIGLTAGCSTSDRYPPHLHYPLRKDPVVADAKGDTRKLTPPGRLDESMHQLLVKAQSDTQNFKVYDPAKLDDADRKELGQALEDLFGTPAKPRVGVEDPAIDTLQLDERELREGSALYRRHCMHCHGVPGDGRGPTGPWVNPYPRDYRRGKFKFISTPPDATAAAGKPRRADLLRVIARGVDGTSMPSFGLLPPRELDRLASYVIHLSIRGEVEFATMLPLLAGDRDKMQDEDGKKLGAGDWARNRAVVILGQWAEADKAGANTPKEGNKAVADPAERLKSIERGYKLFLTDGACIACHTDFGRQPTYKYDEWGTLVRPANLTQPTYRGGRRPIDLYWRVHGGIPPSGMPAAPKISGEQLWDLVNFVQALPYPAMLPEDVRRQVYGASGPKVRDKASGDN